MSSLGRVALRPIAELLEGLKGVEVHNRWLSNRNIVLAGTDAVVLPYVEASQSGVAATAFAAGRPVIATPIGGLTEQVIHRGTGLLAKDMSVEALADAIQAFSCSADLFDHCATGALAHARDELSWQKSASVVTEVITRVRSMPRYRRAQT